MLWLTAWVWFGLSTDPVTRVKKKNSGLSFRGVSYMMFRIHTHTHTRGNTRKRSDDFLLSRTFQGEEPLDTGGGRVFSLDASSGLLATRWPPYA